ncbi:hypothetical protein HUN39_16335 [Methylocystis sp. FS]|uniref:DUF6880 family protein n=1 Tax=Methylocystis TaxID=133 RepID=UPI001581763D|nr:MULTISPECIES: DUF6880 family protein [Methylocystis]MBG0800444.1 hypothetical protein [Methylocystis sp. H4A]NUJ81562.1 hypothetical protein [Methylocystis silviterrae]
MAPKNTLNAQNLEALGAKRLAELLIDISSGDAAAKRRLRLAIAGAQSPADAAREIRKRLTAISRSRSFVDWQNRRALVEDLETQRRAIVEHVGKSDPKEALDLIWNFLALASSVFARCDDSSGTVIGIFHDGVSDLRRLAEAAEGDAKELADRAFEALIGNNYGEFDGLIATLRPALGDPGLQHLKQRFVALSKEPVKKLAEHERRKIGWAMSSPIYENEIADRHRPRVIEMALRDIADTQGDVDAFIAQYDPETRKVPRIPAEIAGRLLAAGRAAEALTAIEAAEQRCAGWPEFEWEDARIAAPDALERRDDAQAARWSCFERFLSARHLRDHLKRLPDFDDVEAESRALDFAENFEPFSAALSFLAAWPAPDRVGKLVLTRADKLDGDRYEVLTPVADALAGKHPLAATLALRAMIEFSLDSGRSSRYKHAARHFQECASLALAIADFGQFEPHKPFVARMRGKHGKKTRSRNLVP